MNTNPKIVALQYFFRIFGRRENIAVLVALFGWLVLWALFQNHVYESKVEKHFLWEQIHRKDSILSVERARFIERAADFRRQIETLKNENETLKKQTRKGFKN